MTSNRRLTLVMPPQHGLLVGFAAGLISLANYITRHRLGVEVEILDLSKASHQECLEQIASIATPLNEHFVGITTTTASYQSAIAIARMFRDCDPSSIIVLGGHHVSGDAETVLRHHADVVSLVAIGEGERSLSELIQQYPSLDAVPGVAYLDEYGQYQRNEPAVPLTQAELDPIDITFQNRGLVGDPGKFDHVTYVSARGCPLKCAFCAVSNESIRGKGIPAVVHDIEQLLGMGFKRIAIEDNFFAHSSRRTKDICTALTEVKSRWGDSFTWDCQTRVESLARSGTVELMESAGCDAVYIGVESLISKFLVYLNKTLQPQKYLDSLVNHVLPHLHRSSINSYINLQFGLPGENISNDRETCRLLTVMGSAALEYGKQITVFPQLHVIYPGTAHFQNGVRDGLFTADIFESFTEWEREQEPILMWLGEHFGHGTGGIPVGILRAGSLLKKEFEIDADAVTRVSAVLKAIDRIPGIQAFMYGDHIVRAGSSLL